MDPRINIKHVAILSSYESSFTCNSVTYASFSNEFHCHPVLIKMIVRAFVRLHLICGTYSRSFLVSVGS